MASLRDLADCVEARRYASGRRSLLRHYFGFRRRALPTPPDGSAPSVSVLDWVRGVQRQHIHINIVRVGSDSFTDADLEQIDYGTYRVREIYGDELGVGRVRHYHVETADADGLDTPSSTADMREITDSWGGQRNGIDVFVPFSYSDPNSLGMLPAEGDEEIIGSCRDGEDTQPDGVVLGRRLNDEGYARTFAHEIGHYLGLQHPPDASPVTTANTCGPPGTTTNDTSRPCALMAQTCQAQTLCGRPVPLHDATDLNDTETRDMGDHCITREACP